MLGQFPVISLRHSCIVPLAFSLYFTLMIFSVSGQCKGSEYLILPRDFWNARRKIGNINISVCLQIDSNTASTKLKQIFCLIDGRIMRDDASLITYENYSGLKNSYSRTAAAIRLCIVLTGWAWAGKISDNWVSSYATDISRKVSSRICAPELRASMKALLRAWPLTTTGGDQALLRLGRRISLSAALSVK